MKIELKKENKLQREYIFSVTEEEVRNGVNDMVVEVAPKVKIKGYRDGHVPHEVVKEKHLSRFITEFVSKQMQEAIDKEVSDKKLELATNPVIKDEMNITKIADIKIKVLIELVPTVPKIDYNKFDIELPQLEITPSELDKELQSLAESKAKLTVVTEQEQKIINQHVVSINFTGSVDGVEFEGGKGENYNLEIGSGSFIDNFEDQLIGHKVGDEFTVDVTFPQQYQQTSLAGKKAQFKVKINKIHSKESQPIDDELAKMLGMQSLEELKAKITLEVSAVMNSTFYLRIKKKLFNTILAKNNFALPETVIQKEVESRITSAAKKGNTLDKKEVTVEAEKELRIWYFIQDTIKKEGENIKDSEFTDFVARRAVRDNLGDPVTILQMCRTNKALLNAISDSFREEKVIDLTLGRMKAKVVKMNKKDFLDYIEKINPESGEEWKIKRKNFLG
ncbi:MAG: trigger factor [Alphaproteobacteria bacterium]|nr:trigger factor [Rickettsiales bacterium]